MKFQKNLVINKLDTIKTAMIKIKKNGSRTVIVLDKNKKLLGTLSEGDIHTALIKNAKVSEKIDNYYNKYPKNLFKT